MLTVTALSKRYTPDKPSLEAVDLQADVWTITAVIGPSGAGKTTLLRSLNQLLKDDEGQVCLDDVDLRQLSKRDLQRRAAISA